MNKPLGAGANINRIKRSYYIAASSVLFCGMAIYAFFRDTNNMFLFRYVPKLSILNASSFLLKTDSIWKYFFVFNLPYGLWCLSGLLFIRAIWLCDKMWGKIYDIVFIAIVMSYVFLKLPGLIPGTFDLLDLVFMGSFAFMESLIFHIFIRRKI